MVEISKNFLKKKKNNNRKTFLGASHCIYLIFFKMYITFWIHKMPVLCNSFATASQLKRGRKKQENTFKKQGCSAYAQAEALGSYSLHCVCQRHRRMSVSFRWEVAHKELKDTGIKRTIWWEAGENWDESKHEDWYFQKLDLWEKVEEKVTCWEIYRMCAHPICVCVFISDFLCFFSKRKVTKLR